MLGIGTGQKKNPQRKRDKALALSALNNPITIWDGGSSAKTITSGDQVDAITADSGLNLAKVDAEDYVLDRPNQMNGQGAIEFIDTTQMLYTGFTASASQTFIIALENPTHLAGGGLIYFGNSGGGTDNQAKITQSGGIWYYSLGQDNTAKAISSAQKGGEIYYGVFEFRTLDTLRVTWYDVNGKFIESTTIDPNDDYAAWDSVLLGARTSGDENSAYKGLRIGSLLWRTRKGIRLPS